MGLSLIGLVVALIPTRSGVWLDYSTVASPVCCFFGEDVCPDWNSSSTLSAFVISTILLVTSYSARIIKLFKSSSLLARQILHKSIGEFVKSRLDLLHGFASGGLLLISVTWIPYGMSTISYIITRAMMNLIDSMLWEVFVFITHATLDQILTH